MSYPALHMAAMLGHIDAVLLMLDNGADINFEVSINHTPLIMASSYGHKDIAKVLIERGVDVCLESLTLAEKITREKGFKDIVEMIQTARGWRFCLS